MKKVLIVLLSILLIFPMTVLGLEEDIIEEKTGNEIIIENEDTLEEEKKEDELIEDKKDNEIIDEEKEELEIVNEIKTLDLEDVSNENEQKREISESNNITYDTPQNGVPLVIIRVDESEEAIQAAREEDPEHEYGTVEEMNESYHHTVRSVGTMEIIVPDDFESEYDLKNSPVGEQKLSYIRGRGNSTWMISNKKPYKVKYDKKQDVLGMGKDKEWGLLANSFDPTLTHNAIAKWIGEEMGMEFTPKMVPVDLVIVGSVSGSSYLGSYYLTELTDIGNNRIEINELDEDDTKDITGGYLISIYYEDQDFKEPENTVFETEYSKVKFINENPYFDEGELTEGQEAQREYIRDYVNQIDDLIMNNEEIDENIHKQIGDLLDLKSTADYWLIQEFFVNFDGYKTSSNYLYKKENGKLYWGPLWDFDLMLYLVDYDEPSHVMGYNKVLPFPWLDNLRSNDPEFVKLLKEEWAVMNEKLIELTEEGGVLDEYKERQRKSWDANYELWRIDNYYDNETTIDQEFDKMRTIIDNRRVWFNDNLDRIGVVNVTVSYEVDDVIVRVDTIKSDSLLEDIDLKPTKEGLLFDGWVDKETKEKMAYNKIFNDIVLVPNYVSPDEIEDEIIFFLSNYEDWVSLYDEVYENSPKIYPEDYYELICNNIKWTSSDDSVASIEDGAIKLNSTGDVMITATIFNGDSKSFLLHVYDENTETIDEPDDFVLESDTYTIEVGEIIQLVTSFVPNKPIDSWYYIEREVSDDEVIDVDYSNCYIVKGLKEGVATVTLGLYSSFSDSIYVTKTVTINVIEKVEETKEEIEENSNDSESNTSQTTNNKVVKLSNKKQVINKVTNTELEETNESDLIEVVTEEVEADNNTETVTTGEENTVINEVVEETKKEESSNLVWILVTLAILGFIIFFASSKASKSE